MYEALRRLAASKAISIRVFQENSCSACTFSTSHTSYMAWPGTGFLGGIMLVGEDRLVIDADSGELTACCCIETF